MIDLSSINATEFKTAGWDLSIDYQKSTPIGTFDLYTMGSLINYEKRRLTYTNPSLDYVGYPSNAGAAGGEARAKANTTLTWQYGKWTAGWTASWFSGYKQSGAPGDPNYYGDTSNPATRSIILAQGGFTIPSQMYHDVFVSYAIGRNPGAGNHRLINVLAANTTIQLGVKNVFNTLPPFDAFYAPYYFSPYGDARLRNYTISIRRSF